MPKLFAIKIMKEKIRKNLFQFIKEIIPIIVGILIALFIDNWNVERKDRVYINQVFTMVDSELKESKEEILATIPRQETLIDSLNFYATNKEVSVLTIVMKSKGIYLPPIKLNAWKAVSTNKIDLVDYKKVTTLSNIEELKGILSGKGELLMNFIYANINETDERIKMTIKLILLDIIQTEKTLQLHIEAFEKEK